MVLQCMPCTSMWVRSLAQLVRALGTVVRIPIMAITFSCAAIHIPAVYNLQRHQRPVPLVPCLYGVGG